jgi:hypothetical protein
LDNAHDRAFAFVSERSHSQLTMTGLQEVGRGIASLGGGAAAIVAKICTEEEGFDDNMGDRDENYFVE